jgi:hypothetical protein
LPDSLITLRKKPVQPAYVGTRSAFLELPWESDQVVFSLQAVSSGVNTLILSATFEVHQGYPGPALGQSQFNNRAAD